jgi:hypothetical protein
MWVLGFLAWGGFGFGVDCEDCLVFVQVGCGFIEVADPAVISGGGYVANFGNIGYVDCAIDLGRVFTEQDHQVFLGFYRDDFFGATDLELRLVSFGFGEFENV